MGRKHISQDPDARELSKILTPGIFWCSDTWDEFIHYLRCNILCHFVGKTLKIQEDSFYIGSGFALSSPACQNSRCLHSHIRCIVLERMIPDSSVKTVILWMLIRCNLLHPISVEHWAWPSTELVMILSGYRDKGFFNAFEAFNILSLIHIIVKGLSQPSNRLRLDIPSNSQTAA